jgi:amino acid transporter
VFSRRGGIYINNVFAVLKICILLTIIVLGFIKVGGGFSGSGLPNGRDNFRVSQSLKSSSSTDVASIVDSIFFICYTYSGFDQPFYVLSEVSRPREIFPKATNIAMGIAGFLFFLTNVAFFCAVPKDMAMNSSLDMATLFFNNIFGNEKAERALAAIIAFTIFGNILVMTFTAARVKQEIAKEGILPYSLTFATGYVTPWAWLMRRFQARPAIETEAENQRNIEYTPMAALGLHFLSSLFLVAITSGLKVDTAYNFLVILYSYVLVSLVGFVVSGGLLYLTFFKRSEWRSILAYKGWLGPVPAIFYFVANGFFLFAAFAKPSDGSPYSQKHTGLPWYLVPTIGLSSLTWGVIWYGGFKLYSRIAKKRMVHVRTRFLLPENVADPGGRWLQRSEMVVIRWPTRVRSSRSSLAEAGEDTNSLHSSNAEVAAKE